MSTIRQTRVLFILALIAFAPRAWAQDTAAFNRQSDNGLVREVRIALVCYGGSSLAIYIHGNAKELHRLVVASKALQKDAPELQAEIMNSDKVPERRGKFGSELEGSTQIWYDRLLYVWWKDPKKVRTRVVVDVIAGTSAGGINGVILAKALAHDLKQDPLTKLWMEKASLRKLTDNYLGLFRIFGGKAPINGNALVGWLYQALDGMDQEGAKNGLGTHSLLPDGDRLDLFVTTTDLYGYPQQIVVNDPPLAAEKHYPHVLHFSYDGKKGGCKRPQAGFDDFCPAWTPSMAFAARASSSIPGVFPPLNLDETLTRLKGMSGKPIDGVSPAPPVEAVVKSYFRNYQLQNPDRKETWAKNTFFVDGGVLDNHPFGPAIAEIRRRPNDQEVKRFLLYLQPDPGKPPTEPSNKKPGLIGTVWKGLSGIPANQPILNDLNDIVSYNEKVRRISEIVAAEEAAAAGSYNGQTGGDCDKPATLDPVQRFACASGFRLEKLDEDLLNLDRLRAARQQVEEAAEQNVIALGRSYYSLRVHSVLDQFVEVISSQYASDYPAESAHRALVAAIIERWANETHLIGKVDKPEEQQKEFLKKFDVGYQRRQLRFVSEWIDEQYKTLPDQKERIALDELKTAAASRISDLTQLVRGQDPVLLPQAKKVRELFDPLNPWALKDGKPETLDILAATFVKDHKTELNALTESLGIVLLEKQQAVRAESFKNFKEKGLDLTPEKRRQILVRYFFFPFWDRQIYPLMAFSNLGELSEIEVVRMSPDDAHLLGEMTAKQKLIGASKAHFGAFFSREGREADYVWGRLDAAERLLTVLGIPEHGAKELFQSVIDEVRAKEHDLIRESILKDREEQIKAMGN